MLFNLLATDYTMPIIFGVVVLLFVVMGIYNSKQRKKQMAEDQQRKDSLCKGTKVITIGGIVGKVVSVDHAKNTFVLETEGTKINFDKRAIYQMELPENAKAVSKKEVNETVEVAVEENKEVKEEKKPAKSKKTAQVNEVVETKEEVNENALESEEKVTE